MGLSTNRRLPPPWVVCLGGLVAAVAAALPALADPPMAPGADAARLAPPLTLDAAVRTALEQNPGIIALRQDHGVAAASVMVARAYPFNPLWEGRFRYAWPVFEGATNQEPVESTVTLELEVRGQRAIREAQAQAGLSRTDWDIANQELTLAVRVVRTFDTVVYRFRKNQLVLDTIDLDQKTYAQGQGHREGRHAEAGRSDRPAHRDRRRPRPARPEPDGPGDGVERAAFRAGRRRAADVHSARRPDRAAAAGRPGGGAGRSGAARVGRIGVPARRPSPRPTPACAWSGPTASATRSSDPRMNTIIRASTTSAFSSRCRCRS